LPTASCSAQSKLCEQVAGKTVWLNIDKQIHLVGERFVLKIHQNTTDCSYIFDVSVSVISWFLCCTCTEVSGVEKIGQCGRLSRLSWLLGAL